MWPFTNSTTPASSSKSVASDLTPPPGPSTQAPSPLASAQPQSTPTATTTSAGRLNIPSGNSAISPVVIDTAQDHLSGDKWTDYKAAFERISVKDDLSRIGETPCARSSLLYGIGGGSAIGAVRYLGSRSPKAGANWAVMGFVVIAITQWEMCNRARAKELAQMKLIQEKFPHRHVSTLKPLPHNPTTTPPS